MAKIVTSDKLIDVLDEMIKSNLYPTDTEMCFCMGYDYGDLIESSHNGIPIFKWTMLTNTEKIYLMTMEQYKNMFA